MTDPRILLAIPVYNEERYVRQVLEEARRHIPDILVVDDGSTDATPGILAAESKVTVIRHGRNRGYGRSLADAFEFAARADYDWLITMDCDEQHEPHFIPKFIAAARAGDADLISGSRYLDYFGSNSEAPADRRRINTAITAMLNRRLGLDITDAFCGFKAYRVAALSAISITEPGYAMPLQLWVQVTRAGLRIVELPVRLIYTDAARHFGGELDDPTTRYQHYVAAFEAELSRSGSCGVASGPICGASCALTS